MSASYSSLCCNSLKTWSVPVQDLSTASKESPHVLKGERAGLWRAHRCWHPSGSQRSLVVHASWKGMMLVLLRCVEVTYPTILQTGRVCQRRQAPPPLSGKLWCELHSPSRRSPIWSPALDRLQTGPAGFETDFLELDSGNGFHSVEIQSAASLQQEGVKGRQLVGEGEDLWNWQEQPASTTSCFATGLGARLGITAG